MSDEILMTADILYATRINLLLRRYIKFNSVNQFERMAAYAELWNIANDETRILQAIMAAKRGHPSQYYL